MRNVFLIIHSIFLVDHAWTFQAECAQKQLEVISGLAARMGSLMGLTDEEGEGEEEGEGSYDADSESGMWRLLIHHEIC